jgi:hypothetical protein
MPDNRPFEMQRLRYWQGQKLLSRDFRDQTSYQAQLRWWHNRALHNSYGVSYGFDVTLQDTRVKIEPGVAYDCYGRELILQTTKEIPLPPDPGEKFQSVTLMAGFEAADRSISGDCSSKQQASRFEWKASRSLEFTDGVPLAEISYEPSAQLGTLPPNTVFPVELAQKVFYDNDRKLLIAIGGLSASEAEELKKISSEVGFVAAVVKLVAGDERSPVLNAHFILRRARALTRPRIGSGATVPGDTAWEVWSEVIVDPTGAKVQADIGIQVTIDTSGAGFTEVPCYFAWLQGTLWNQVHLNFFPVPITHIDLESTRRFRLRLWMPPIITVLGTRIRFANVEPPIRELGQTPLGVRASQPRSFATDFVNFARQQKLYVCWMGIQETIKPQFQPFADCQCSTTVPVTKVAAEPKTAEALGHRRVRQIQVARRRTKP